MADITTSERPPAKVRDEIILEAQRIEERNLIVTACPLRLMLGVVV
jgi:hypothetical protein